MVVVAATSGNDDGGDKCDEECVEDDDLELDNDGVLLCAANFVVAVAMDLLSTTVAGVIGGVMVAVTPVIVLAAINGSNGSPIRFTTIDGPVIGCVACGAIVVDVVVDVAADVID